MPDGVLSTEERNTLNSRVIKNQICHILQHKEIGYQHNCLLHNVNSRIDIPYTAIVIKAVANWAKSKIPLSFD
jgi:hypothetical protein